MYIVEQVPLTTEPTELMSRARGGDPLAFEQLIRPHINSVRRFALSFAKNPVDADDLAQDALIKAYRSFHTFDGAAALTTWLYTVARSTFLDSRRGKLHKARGRERELDDAQPDDVPTQEARLGEREAAEQLWSAIRELDAKFRVPLVLADVEGMTYEEVASIEGVPIGTVRSRIARARAKLAEALTQSTDPPTRHPRAAGTERWVASSNSWTRGTR